jgi:hypothetical protein
MYIKFFVRKPEGKRSLETGRRRWKDSIRIYIEEINRMLTGFI